MFLTEILLFFISILFGYYSALWKKYSLFYLDAELRDPLSTSMSFLVARKRGEKAVIPTENNSYVSAFNIELITAISLLHRFLSTIRSRPIGIRRYGIPNLFLYSTIIYFRFQEVIASFYLSVLVSNESNRWSVMACIFL